MPIIGGSNRVAFAVEGFLDTRAQTAFIVHD
jgi:hypothetical protein